MDLVLLTLGNLSFVKRRLRDTYPSVKSSHLTEGLAAAFGENTHAALRARIAKQAYVEPAQLDLDRWVTRLTELGYLGISAEPLADVVRDHELPDHCWKAISKNDSAAINDWYYQCRHNNVPFIYVSIARKYARLEWDCISTNGGGDKGVTGSLGDELVSAMFSSFQQLAINDTARPKFDGSAFVGAIERLTPSTAFTIANTFFLKLFHATRPLLQSQVT